MNLFQQKIIKKYPQFTEDDFESENIRADSKVKALNLPVPECLINEIFVGLMKLHSGAGNIV
jgi:hypothetical protein